MRLPTEQQALLTTLLPELRQIASYLQYSMLYGQDLCEPSDLLQEALSSMYTATVYPPPDLAQLKTWSGTMLKRRALDYLAKRKRDRDGSYGHVQELDYYAIPAADCEERVAYVLKVAQKHLRPIVNQVIIGYYKGYSGTQIAEHLGIPRNTVKTHFYAAKLRLRKLCVTAD
jgi:RNA polymerase sigma factor (sigma-70 family)